MRAIFVKDFRAFFTDFRGYIYIVAMLVLGGITFNGYAGSLSIGEAKNLFANFHVAMVFLIPVLTMNSYAKEQYKKTDRLLLSGPVPVFAIATAKLAAVYAVYLIGLVLAIAPAYVYLLVSGAYSSQLLLTFFGYALFGLALTSLGNFVSSYSQRPIRAYIFCALVFLVFWLLYGFLESISNSFLHQILSALSVYGRIEPFEYGWLQPSAIIYLISFALVFWLLTGRTIYRYRAGRD